jgi:hypothetical protein
MKVKGWSFLLSLVILLPLSAGAKPIAYQLGFKGIENTVPPEILEQAHPDILNGRRPRFKTITQNDIFSLREDPKFAADLIRLDLDANALSSLQKDILTSWIVSGSNTIVLDGKELEQCASLLNINAIEAHHAWSLISTNLDQNPEIQTLVLNPNSVVNLNVNEVQLAADRIKPGMGKFKSNSSLSVVEETVHNHGVWIGLDPNTVDDADIVASVIDEMDEVVVAGRFAYKGQKVYFLSSAKMAGMDADLFRLKFWHWAMGLDIPGIRAPGGKKTAAAKARLQKKQVIEEQKTQIQTAALPDAPEGMDTIVLNDGNHASGYILTETIALKSKFGVLNIPIEQIRKVSITENRSGTFVMQGDDKISGTVETAKIAFRFKTRLGTDTDTEIEIDTIKEIIVKAQHDQH